jgi:hypothetical protein
MQAKDRGEASVTVPGACLCPARLRVLSEKRLKRLHRFRWSRTSLVAEELLFAPYFYFRFVNSRYRNRLYLYDILVDGILGFCELIRGTFELRRLSVSADLLLDKALLKEEAEAKAREAVKSLLLRRQSLWVKEIKVERTEAVEIYYPYWLCYLETRKGIELLGLNGITGTAAGPRAEDILRAGIARMEWRQAEGNRPRRIQAEVEP